MVYIIWTKPLNRQQHACKQFYISLLFSFYDWMMSNCHGNTLMTSTCPKCHSFKVYASEFANKESSWCKQIGMSLFISAIESILLPKEYNSTDFYLSTRKKRTVHIKNFNYKSLLIILLDSRSSEKQLTRCHHVLISWQFGHSREGVKQVFYF